MHDPDLVVLDEPTSGLDPLMQRRFNDLVRAESEAGTTVFFSSHVLSEVRRICERVAVIRDGRLVTTERVDDLLDRSGKLVRARVADDDGDLDVAGVHGLEATREDGVTDLRFTFTGDVNELVAALSARDLHDVSISEAPLEEVFARFYGGDDA
jgi:ABC-2 type transport system ATP-binding protein